MTDARTRARNSVQEFVSAWLAGDHDAVSSVCAATVRWWSPLGGGTVEGRAATCTELARVLALAPHPREIAALAVNEDGTTAVIEIRAATPAPGGRPTFVTSVVSLSAGRITDGRTYVDVGPRAAAAS